MRQRTKSPAKTESVIEIEDPQVAWTLKYHHLAQALGDVGFGEFRRQLVYMAAWCGSRVVLADRWKPSGRTCSGRGWTDEGLELEDRTFHHRKPLLHCGPLIDRDLNAAITLSKPAGSS